MEPDTLTKICTLEGWVVRIKKNRTLRHSSVVGVVIEQREGKAKGVDTAHRG